MSLMGGIVYYGSQERHFLCSRSAKRHSASVSVHPRACLAHSDVKCAGVSNALPPTDRVRRSSDRDAHRRTNTRAQSALCPRSARGVAAYCPRCTRGAIADSTQRLRVFGARVEHVQSFRKPVGLEFKSRSWRSQRNPGRLLHGCSNQCSKRNGLEVEPDGLDRLPHDLQVRRAVMPLPDALAGLAKEAIDDVGGHLVRLEPAREAPAGGVEVDRVLAGVLGGASRSSRRNSALRGRCGWPCSSTPAGAGRRVPVKLFNPSCDHRRLDRAHGR